MCEITKNNFHEFLPEIEYNLRKATFISIDCEFSGLRSDPNIKYSLFDCAEDRYIKLKSNLHKFIALQFGLSTYQYNRDLNQYDASTYKFNIFPRCFGDFIDPQFLSQASSFEFLCKFNFDFNKVLYDGLPYLNQEQQNFLSKKIEDKTFSTFVFSSLDIDEEKSLHEISTSFSLWLKNVTSDNDVYSFSLQHNHDRFIYALSLEIRRKFPNAWCFREGNIIKLKIVSEEERKQLEEDNKDPELKLYQSYCGFSRVFNLLSEIKKPIVGHNLLLDLLIIYNQFYKPLPASLKDFKKDIVELFPSLYDTKLIAYYLQKTLEQSDKLHDTSLSCVYNFVTNRGIYLVPFAPKVQLRTDFKDVESQQIHDAGWDAYITGFSFIRLCHLTACKKRNVNRPLTSPEHLKSVENLKNKVNLARASLMFIDLVNKERVSDVRPPLLYVACRKNNKIDINHLTVVFAKYGGFDVKPINSYSALLAVASYGSANDILKDFFKHNELRVERYTFFRHSQAFRYCLWAGIFVPLIGLGIALTLKKPEKPS